MKKKLVVLQDTSSSCGAACLLSIVRYYGGNVNYHKIINDLEIDQKGTNFYKISQTARLYGLQTDSYYIEKEEEFEKIKSPMICQINKNNVMHFVVVYIIKNNYVFLMDPVCGFVKINKKEFYKEWTRYILIFKQTSKICYYKNDNNLMKTILKILIKNKVLLINIILFTFIFSFLSSIYPFYLKIVIDYINKKNNEFLFKITIIFIAIQATSNVFNYFKNKLQFYLSKKIDNETTITIIEKLLLLPHKYYKSITKGDIISRVNDITEVKNEVNNIICSVFFDIIILLIMTVIFIFKNLYILILLLATLIIFYLINKINITKYENVIKEEKEKNSVFYTKLLESLEGYETIKGLHVEKNAINYIKDKYNGLINTYFKRSNLINNENFLYDIVTSISLLALNYFCIICINNNIMTTGELATYNTLFLYYIGSVHSLLIQRKEMILTKASIIRISELLEYDLENFNYHNNFKIDGNIKINNLTFKYHDKEIIKNINIQIPKYNKVLLIGESASGKTTLLNILFKYLDIGGEQVYLNNIDINKYSLDEIRKNVTLISQNEILYNDTIRNNIILGRNVGEEELNEVCSVVDFDRESFDTMLYENGQNISSGQRQKIILARSLLKTSSIFLLDESLGHIDINSERRILKNIFKRYSDKTFIIVSHNLENMDLFNQVIKFNNGKCENILCNNS